MKFHFLTLFSLLHILIITGCSSLALASRNSTEVFYENASGTPVLEFLRSATQSIDIEIYEMDDSLVHTEILNALARGVRVRILKDGTPVGGSCKVFEPARASDTASCQSEKQLVEQVQKAGGAFLPFNKAALCAIPGSKCFEHGKMVIVDQKKVLLSTGNFNTSNLCFSSESPTHCNRDYTVLSSDQNAVHLLESVFEKDLAGTSYDVSQLIAKSATTKVTISPYSLAPLVHFIQSAKRILRIQNQYLKDPDLNAAIIAAARRGVKVSVVVASACSFGTPTAGDAQKWTDTYTAFDDANIKTRIFTRAMQVKGVSGYLHAKAIVVDDARAWVGSVNGSTTSLSNNREYGIFLNEPAEVLKLAQFMYNDFVDINSESWRDSLACKNDPLPLP